MTPSDLQSITADYYANMAALTTVTLAKGKFAWQLFYTGGAADSVGSTAPAPIVKNASCAADLREVAGFVPLERLLIETDSPYLAPVPYRGKTNQPAFVPWVAQQIGDLRGLSREEVGHITSENFERLFGRVNQPKLNEA
jgi:hypothetical protein